MPCFHPWSLDGVQKLPCGQCRGCRRMHANEWAMRCMHEAQMHEHNCFVTLTYDDDHLPPDGSLDGPVPDGKPRGPKIGAWARFMKKLRKEVGPVRYYHVGEYGTVRNRPHYHGLLFGWRPSDQELFTVRSGFSVFTSELLRKTWDYGLHEVGSVTPQSAAYCTGYVKRKMTGSWAKAKYGDREPEYGRMSRNPGIGAGWIDKYKCEVYPADSVVVRGSFVRPPRYYDLRVEQSEPMLVDGVRCGRHNRRRVVSDMELAAAEKIMAAKDDIYDMGGVL